MITAHKLLLITAGHSQLQISVIVLKYATNVWICTSIDKETDQFKVWSYSQIIYYKDPALSMTREIAKNLK